MNSTEEINECRLCVGKLGTLKVVCDFGNVPLANDFVDSQEVSAGLFPLTLCRCTHCDSFQIKHNVSPSVLFTHYSYTSPEALIPHFKKFANEVSMKLKLDPDAKILEIGGNIGLLGEEFKKLGYDNLYNVDPAENLAEDSIKRQIKTYTDFFNEDFAERFVTHHGQVDLVVGLNVFAHIPDLKSIFRGIKKVLKPDGYVVFENAYLLDTLRNKDVGQIYHEHIFLHSIRPLNSFLSSEGFSIEDIDFNGIQGGSFRITAGHQGGHPFDRQAAKKVVSVIAHEQADLEGFLNRMSTYLNDAGSVLENILKSCREEERKVVLYGVPAKIALVNHLFEIDQYLDYAVEDASIKVGKLVPGTNVKIYNSSKISELTKRDVIVIGAYNFAKEIIEKTKAAGFEGVFIRLIPLEVYG